MHRKTSTQKRAAEPFGSVQSQKLFMDFFSIINHHFHDVLKL